MPQGAAQAPVKARVGAQAVEEVLAGFGQRKVVANALGGGRQIAGHHIARRQGFDPLTGLEHAKAVGRSGGPGSAAPLQQKGVTPGNSQRARVEIGEIVVAADLLAKRVDQPPGCICRGAGAVEDETVTLQHVESKGVALVRRVQGAAHRHLRIDGPRRVQVDEAKRIIAGSVQHTVHRKRVVACRQLQHRRRVIGVRLGEGAVTDQVAARTRQAPGKSVGVCQGVEGHAGVAR